jgi:hypothetical protein
MLEDKAVCVRRLRDGYEFFKSMAQRRSDLEATRHLKCAAVPGSAQPASRLAAQS